jgi:multisubunit Na+/H+ antiporter MnhC subunit
MLVDITLPLVGTLTMPLTAAMLITGWVIGMALLIAGFIDTREEKVTKND